MAHTLLTTAARMHTDGKSPQEIAEALGVSEVWISMVMGADSFRVLVESRDESEGT